ncbi:MAG: biotin transporter BioY [Actinomycetota bacterium]|nr:biotin transporter BioY [Actinomycetota bacterium]
MRIGIRDMVLVALFAALTAIGAWIRIPIQPVPITFQVFFALLAGAILGAWLGALSQIIYILLGCIGLPVFAGGSSGLGVLFGPTGGYLFGFVIGAYLIGGMVGIRQNPGYLWFLVSMLLGVAVIYLLGMIQLMMVTRMTFQKALAVGVLPFIGIDLIKAIVAALVAQRLKDAFKTL